MTPHLKEEYLLKSATSMKATGLAALLLTCGSVLTVRATPGLEMTEDWGFGARHVRFDADGAISLDDLDGPGNHAVGSYTTAGPIAFALNFDLNAQTYGFTADGVALVQDDSIGIPPQGIGAFLIGLDHDGDSGGTFFLDDLLVTATDVTEPVTPMSWGGVKALYTR